MYVGVGAGVGKDEVVEEIDVQDRLGRRKNKTSKLQIVHFQRLIGGVFSV